MKITEENINHNAVLEITKLVDTAYEYSDADDSTDNIRLVTLGEIRGICQMAKIMKEVLAL